MVFIKILLTFASFLTIKIIKMKRIVLFFGTLLFFFTMVPAQQAEPSSQRTQLIRAFEQQMAKGQAEEGVASAVKAVALYCNSNQYNEAFSFLNDVDNAIVRSSLPLSKKETLRYQTSRERMQMYIRMHRKAGAGTQLENMYFHSNKSGDEKVQNDFLYNKVIYLYTFGEYTKGNEVFKEMAQKLTQSKEYDKVDKVYQTLIVNGRKSGSAYMVDQTYRNYIVWKDSVDALKVAAQIDSLNQRITDQETSIAEKDSSLSTRMALITAFSIIIGVLIITLILGVIMLMRVGVITKKQKKTIKEANENIALKAHFIGNISSQLEPALKKLDKNNPDVQALLNFSNHVQQLSSLECQTEDSVEKEDVQVQNYCEEMMDQIRKTVRKDVVLTVNAPKMSVAMNKEYVSHILLHLLQNAAEVTPAEGHIRLEFKKRGAHTFQFLVSDTGEGIPVEKQEDVFKAFVEVHDLTKGDGLGLPICKQMAKLMNGDLGIDSSYTKGTRFVLDLHD